MLFSLLFIQSRGSLPFDISTLYLLWGIVWNWRDNARIPEQRRSPTTLPVDKKFRPQKLNPSNTLSVISSHAGAWSLYCCCEDHDVKDEGATNFDRDKTCLLVYATVLSEVCHEHHYSTLSIRYYG